MKVKIFESTVSGDELENKIFDWTMNIRPKIVSTNVSAQHMNDFYENSEGRVCNQWIHYMCAVVYE